MQKACHPHKDPSNEKAIPTVVCNFVKHTFWIYMQEKKSVFCQVLTLTKPDSCQLLGLPDFTFKTVIIGQFDCFLGNIQVAIYSYFFVFSFRNRCLFICQMPVCIFWMLDVFLTLLLLNLWVPVIHLSELALCVSNSSQICQKKLNCQPTFILFFQVFLRHARLTKPHHSHQKWNLIKTFWN